MCNIIILYQIVSNKKTNKKQVYLIPAQMSNNKYGGIKVKNVNKQTAICNGTIYLTFTTIP